jgi:uncharacterized membrane protein YkvI
MTRPPPRPGSSGRGHGKCGNQKFSGCDQLSSAPDEAKYHPMSDHSRIWRVYALPAAVFQSVMIGGGYGTGREIVEYFTRFGVLGGLLGLGLVTVCFAVLLAVSYEFARVYQAYDYARFFRALLGRGWIAFELLYLAMFALVLAVIAAAAGKLFEEQLQVPGIVGLGLLLLTVTILAFYGRQWVTRILAFKAVLLSTVFLAYFAAIISSSGRSIVLGLSRSEVLDGWTAGALRYALYSAVVIPAMLFATTAIETRREAIGSGAITAAVGILPGVLLHLSFAVGYPQVLTQPIPVHWMMTSLNVPALTVAYIVVLFGCFLDTGLCFIQSVNERLDGWRLESQKAPISRPTRAAIAILCVLASGCLSFFGVVNLIAQGYGTMAWGFLALYVAPILTVGLYRLIQSR